MRRAPLVLAVLGVAALPLTGCGRADPDDEPRGRRPAAEADVTVAIAADGVRLSPGSIGAGPVRLLVTNQTARAVRPALAAAGSAAIESRDPIAPGGIAAIQGTVTAGRWRLAVPGGPRGATLAVSARRPSTDGDLLLP